MNFETQRFSILDEIDSGLDVDAMKSIALSINRFRTRKLSFTNHTGDFLSML